MDDTHASEALLQQGYQARDAVWSKIGRLDSHVLAHAINPAFQGMPEWPDLRQSYKIIHLDNGHTIIATDGLSDPFMKDHAFYKPGVNGFGLELYIEITEPFDMGKAGYTWWYNLLYQAGLQVAYSGNLLEILSQYGGMLSSELYNVPGLPDDHTKEGRAPVLFGAPSNNVPSEIPGPLSPIHFVSVTLLNLDELQFVLDNPDTGRQRIAEELSLRYGSPISDLGRSSVHISSILTIDASNSWEKELTHESVSRLESLLKMKIQGLDAFWAEASDANDEFHTFQDLFEILPCSLWVDWKWHPEALFSESERLRQLLPGHEIKLEYNDTLKYGGPYDVVFTFDGKQEKLTTDTPDEVLVAINKHLTDKQFISIVFDEDGYDWLLAPRDVDIGALKEIIEAPAANSSSGEAQSVESPIAQASSTPPIMNTGEDEATTGKIDVTIKQAWVEKSSDTALEEFKSVLTEVLNRLPEDRYADKDRWSVSEITNSNEAHLLYDGQSIATLKFQDGAMRFTSQPSMPRYNDVMYSLRYAAMRLSLAVYSHAHGDARLPQNAQLSIDATYFRRDKAMVTFFEGSKFIPRFALEGVENLGDGKQAVIMYPPYYAEHKDDGSMHIINDAMLKFLLEKNDQNTNREFSYRVADSMQNFTRKYDLGLIPSSFYQNYGRSTKIINQTYFDIGHINRKVFIDPYVWDFDDEHNAKFYKNVKNGLHIMDKVRKGENLDGALKRVLREELEAANDYVGARVVALDFDRDRDGILTPRLVVHVFVHGMTEKRKSQSHDWVSVK